MGAARPRGGRVTFLPTGEERERIAAEMAQAYLAGATFAELAAEFGCCENTARTLVLSQGVTPRRRGMRPGFRESRPKPPPPMSQDRRDAVAAQLREGMAELLEMS